jgi:hypothetical protein
MRDGHQNTAKVVKPTILTSHHPLIMLFFGGGFCVGTPEQMTHSARDFARAFVQTIV